MAAEGVGRAADEGGMDGEQSNVYGFTKHPSCNHPPTAIPYFAVDITAAGYMRARACVYICVCVCAFYVSLVHNECAHAWMRVCARAYVCVWI